ncbi:MAG: SPOR domain-containing protein [Bacteroidota bacterium]
MNIDIAKAIRELLYEHDTVMVPGLGGFTAMPAPATVDYVQSTVSPPTKKLEFNPNLTLNDGILVNHVQKIATITAQEALSAVERYVETVHQALERREIIEIPQVGRLYMDYEQKIRYMPEGTNFNLDAYGLPTVPFSPVVRERPTVMPEPKPAPAATLPATQASQPSENGETESMSPSAGGMEKQPGLPGLQRLLPWLIVLSAVVIALTVFLIFSEKNGSIASPDMPVDSSRVNVSPNPGDRSLSPAEDTLSTVNEDSPTDAATAPAEDDNEVRPSPSESAESAKKKAFIVVHSFGVRENAQKFASQLTDAGYEPETKRDGLYKVGVVLSYDSQKEVDDLVKKLGAKFQSEPKVLEEN